MSGFVGILHPDGSPVDPAVLAGLTQSMAYCGPDHLGTWVAGQIGLGHALLADSPSPSPEQRQPRNFDGRLWIAADARLDGRSDLLRLLRSHGRDVPLDAPDSQLILHAYDVWEDRCVENIIGDFAFAIWDSANRRLFCARDHFGVVPFYYAAGADTILFGNVLRALRMHSSVSDELNDRAIGDFLLFGMNLDAASTTFADIRALPPAHVLTWEGGHLLVRRHWNPPTRVRELRLRRPEEYVERFKELLDLAVDDRLRWNKLGAHLTGGMDSTSAVATAAGILRSRGGDFDLRAYTLSSRGMKNDEESRFAQEVAAMLRIPLELLAAIDYETRNPNENARWVFPEPVRIAEQSADYEVLTRVSAFARALLSGLGGDPLLLTYPHWPRGLRQWRDRTAFAWNRLLTGRMPRVGLRSALRRKPLRGWAKEPPRLDWINPDFALSIDMAGRWEEVRADPGDTSPYGVLVHPTWAAIFGWSHPGTHGIPVRLLFPFFDLRLVQFVKDTPAYPWHQEKRLLREAMRGRLPTSVLERPKTPLFSITERVTDDPRYRLALLPETRRWRRELLSVPDLCKYVNVNKALQLVEASPVGNSLSCFSNSFPLAHWLLTDGADPNPQTREDTAHVNYEA